MGNVQQGWSVSVFGDGNTAIIGGWADNSSAGAAWVWTRSGGVTTFWHSRPKGDLWNYQWHDGAGILANATNSSLTITNAQADASYYVVVSNSYGSVTSQSAQLKILVDYNTAIPTPISPTPPPPPPKPPSQHNLVVMTHGWQPIGVPQWVYDMTNSIGVSGHHEPASQGRIEPASQIA